MVFNLPKQIRAPPIVCLHLKEQFIVYKQIGSGNKTGLNLFLHVLLGNLEYLPFADGN